MARLVLTKGEKTDVILPSQTGPGVRRVMGKIARDIQNVCGAECEIRGTAGNGRQAILVATLGCGELWDQLRDRIPELAGLEGQWETYGFYLLDHPLPQVETGLVICGSDRLGTIYGMFHLSELLGVTALGFWGDVTPGFHERVILTGKDHQTQAGEFCVQVDNGNSREPSVKYRGFFINDEWPCFGNWTFSHYKGFTAEMYDKVFEYLLRMKGNYLWPAMWTSSFLLDGPGMAAMELADEYGIYIGMSHHEPCMRSSEEWDLVKGEDSPYGTAWDYRINKEGLLRYWEDGLIRSKGHQVFPTIGMRGERDSKMLGEQSTVEENVRLLKEIIASQRKLIAKHLNPDLRRVPQLFAVYKEVEDYYFGEGRDMGLRGWGELDGVTLLLCEDNFGNMRALPGEDERDRAGGFGMYYHLDYHGGPVSYEWVNSTPLVRIWEQMTQAYAYGVRELWIVNVGDVKFQEYPLGYFMELAYDFEKWGSCEPGRIKEYTKDWVRRQFGPFAGEEQLRQIGWVLDETARLNGLRRPESLNDQVYHPAHYGEARRMMERCKRLEAVSGELKKALEKTPAKDGYFSMVHYPAAASANLIKMHLYAGWNHLSAAQGKSAANVYGERLENCIRRDRELSEQMAAFRDGKWRGMEQACHIGFTNWNSEDWRYPVRHLVTLPEQPRLVVSRADQECSYTNQYFPRPLVIDDFCDPGAEAVVLQIANGGQGILRWRILHSESECVWLNISKREGGTAIQEEVVVSVNYRALSPGQTAEAQFEIVTETERVPVTVRARRWELEGIPDGTFLPAGGIFTLDAVHFSRARAGSFQGGQAGFCRIEDYGKFESGMKVLPSTAYFTHTGDAPSLTYQLWAEHAGQYWLEIHTSPANPLCYDGGLHLAVSVNGGTPAAVAVVGPDYRGGDNSCAEWETAVLMQEHVCKTEISVKNGLNQITVYAQEAGLVLERLVIFPRGSRPKPSYLGPEESYYIQNQGTLPCR